MLCIVLSSGDGRAPGAICRYPTILVFRQRRMETYFVFRHESLRTPPVANHDAHDPALLKPGLSSTPGG